MESLITVMNKLQDIFSTIGISQNIDIPQIVVVGSQSSGKSSVLESLVGKSFLPRGTGIVTRAPLVLHVINRSEYEEINSGTKDDYAIFLHKPKEMFFDFDKVRKEIERRTHELAGEKKNITDQQIVLNIYTKHMCDLSFVDLPGLTKVPVGDQPKDIEQKIKTLVLQFIQNPNSIILAIVTANTDPATSECLHIAKSVDPNGNRTIAVVTKIDIMDKGTNATELLTGKLIPVQLGIIGVVNRSQKDINEFKTVEQSLLAEEHFFKLMYSNIANQHGTVILAKKLQILLIQKIQSNFSSLKKQIYEMNLLYGAQAKELKEFTNNYDRSLLDIITQITISYNVCLNGNFNNTSLIEPNAGANIAKYFKYTFNQEIENIDPLNGLSFDVIINVINNASGTNLGIFMPFQAFDHLVKQQLQLMEGPSLVCVNFVYDELINNIFHLDNEIENTFKKYPKLKEKILEILQDLLSKYKEKTQESVSKLIRYQEAFINTSHPDFIEAILESNEYHQLFQQLKDMKTKNVFAEPQLNYIENYLNKLNQIKNYSTKFSSKELLKMHDIVEKITTYGICEKLSSQSRLGCSLCF